MSQASKEDRKMPKRMVDFDVLKENWHEYELEDDTVVRSKVVLLKILNASPSEKSAKMPKFLLSSKLLNVVHSPDHLKGKKGRSWPVSELEKFITEPNMKFRRLRDGGLAEYKTKKAIIAIRSRIIQIDKTSKYDVEGNPAYIIRTEGDVLSKEISEETESTE